MWGLFAVDDNGHKTLLSRWHSWAEAKAEYREHLRFGEQRKLLILPIVGEGCEGKGEGA